MLLCNHNKKSKSGIHGIISCFATSNACPNYIACGSYSKICAIIDEKNAGELVGTFSDSTNRMAGVTQVKFSLDGWYIFVGSRKCNEILCWDLRTMSSEPIMRLPRVVSTNQKIGFDIDLSGNYLFTGSGDGQILIYDLQQGGLPVVSPFITHTDCVNGIAFHPCLPLLATSTGERKFCSEKKSKEINLPDEKNAVYIWKFETLEKTSGTGIATATATGI